MTFAVAGALLYFFYRNPHPNPLPRGEGKENLPLAWNYVGSSACASCHHKETAEWQTSQHHDAMAEASKRSVLGSFNNAKFNYAGLSSTFFRRDGKFFVNTDGPDGKLRDYEIKYTFGVYPLQQYLVEFPDGRLQARLDRLGLASQEGRRPALVSSLSQRAGHLRRRVALDSTIAKLELHVRGLPLNRCPQKLRFRHR